MKKLISKSASLAVSPSEFVELSEFERFDDGSGYRAVLRAASGEFACTGREFYFDDLPVFLDRLREAYQRVSGSAELRLRYEEEFLRIELTQLGHIVVSGLLIQYGPFGCRLQFSFEADQSFCPPFIAQLQEASDDLDS
jgi:hypothetical protein